MQSRILSQNLSMFQIAQPTDDLTSLSSVLVDRIETPETEECHLVKKTPLAVLKFGKDRVQLVRIVPAFPTKDLLVPVPADDVMAYAESRIPEEESASLENTIMVIDSFISFSSR